VVSASLSLCACLEDQLETYLTQSRIEGFDILGLGWADLPLSLFPHIPSPSVLLCMRTLPCDEWMTG